MISLVTPLYKSERYLQSYKARLLACLEELGRQNIAYEVIFVPKDPSSTEKVFLDELKAYPWCRIIDSPNPSLYGAWNSGMLEARGEAVGFWPLDDFRVPGGIKEAMTLIGQGADLVYSPFKIRRYFNFLGHDFLVHVQTIRSQVLEFTPENYPEFLRSMRATAFFIFKKSLFLSVGPFDEQFKVAADFDWCVRAAKTGGQFKRGKELSGSFRVDGRGVSAGGKLRHVAENNLVYLRHHAEDKINPVPEELMKTYNPHKLIFRGREFELSANGLMDEKALEQFKSMI